MSTYKKSIGTYGEDLAANFLDNNGYIIILRNIRYKTGEIDIIAKDKNYLCFVEVKTRYGALYGRPSEAVCIKKQHKIIKTAQLYLLKNNLSLYENYRFDVVEVILNLNNNQSKVTLIKNAFGVNY